MNAWGGVHRQGTWPIALLSLAALVWTGCGSGADGGGRGTGLSAVVSGNIADSGADAGPAPTCPFVDGSAVVSIRGTDLLAPVESDCTFEVQDVPPGDVTLDIISDEGTNSVTLNSVPPETVVVFTDVRLRPDATDVAAIEVQPAAPVPGRRFAIIAEPPTGDAPLGVQFSFAPDPTNTTQVKWSFGDRSSGSTDFTPEHSYQQPGDYVVALSVAEPSRPTQEAYLVVRVTEPPVEEPLSVRLSARPQSGPPPLTVQFQASVFGSRPADSLVWNFGDGSPPLATELTTVAHDYLRAGSFLAIVTVTDDLGRQAGNSFPVVVERSAVTVRPTPAATATTVPPSARPTPTATSPAEIRPTTSTIASRTAVVTRATVPATARPTSTAPSTVRTARVTATEAPRTVAPTATRAIAATARPSSTSVSPVRTSAPTGTAPPRTAPPTATEPTRTPRRTAAPAATSTRAVAVTPQRTTRVPPR